MAWLRRLSHTISMSMSDPALLPYLPAVLRFPQTFEALYGPMLCTSSTHPKMQFLAELDDTEKLPDTAFLGEVGPGAKSFFLHWPCHSGKLGKTILESFVRWNCCRSSNIRILKTSVKNFLLSPRVFDHLVYAMTWPCSPNASDASFPRNAVRHSRCYPHKSACSTLQLANNNTTQTFFDNVDRCVCFSLGNVWGTDRK